MSRVVSGSSHILLKPVAHYVWGSRASQIKSINSKRLQMLTWHWCSFQRVLQEILVRKKEKKELNSSFSIMQRYGKWRPDSFHFRQTSEQRTKAANKDETHRQHRHIPHPCETEGGSGWFPKWTRSQFFPIVSSVFCVCADRDEQQWRDRSNICFCEVNDNVKCDVLLLDK